MNKQITAGSGKVAMNGFSRDVMGRKDSGKKILRVFVCEYASLKIVDIRNSKSV